MSYNCIGLSPKINIEMPEILKADYLKLNPKEQVRHTREHIRFHEANPGVSFHCTSFIWKPIWAFVTQVCSEVLTEYQIKYGYYNGSAMVDEDAVERMVFLLDIQIALGNHTRYECLEAKALEDFVEFLAQCGGFIIM